MRAARLSVSLLALTFAVEAAAQTYPPPYTTPASPYTVQPLSDADQLAAQIRLLASDPRNLQALVRAGELALKLDDNTAAGAFFARAERIDPNNGRVKAGEGSLLVAAERPGEALQHFALAERLGDDPRSFAADRGLAYDLVGQQDRAQRDYRVALRTGPDDETQRRYALSLGISGKRDLALAQIDLLLRKSDRGAWRSRAFILAMAGDKAGAEKIATSMMPAGMAQGLQPFFDILPSLRPADRAFAVHFGEVRASPQRIADARLVPALAALGPDPTAPVTPVAVAAVQPAVAIDAREQRRREREARKARGRTALAVVTTPPPVPLPAPPTYAGQSDTSRVVLASNPYRPPNTVAPVQPRPTLPGATFVQRGSSVPVAATPLPAPVFVQPLPSRATIVAVPRSTGAAPSVVTPTVAPVVQRPPVIVAQTVPPQASQILPTSVAPVVAVTTIAPTASAGVVQPAAPTLSAAAETAPVVTANVPAPVIPQRPAPTPMRSEDSILAAIISDIKVPGSETAVETEAAPSPVTETPPVDQAALERRAEAEHALAEQAAAEQRLAEKKAADRKAADRKALADKKAADAKKLADKKLADAKAAEEKRRHDPKILEPSRVWVQVAGGANENDLPKQWAKLRGGKGKAFAGRSGWTTPLRATNRILTGPFKSEDEAQSFVNGLAKDGLSGFVFVSEAGQKITKLPAK